MNGGAMFFRDFEPTDAWFSLIQVIPSAAAATRTHQDNCSCLIAYKPLANRSSADELLRVAIKKNQLLRFWTFASSLLISREVQ